MPLPQTSTLEHVALQPSPEAVLESSQTSPTSRAPLPQLLWRVVWPKLLRPQHCTAPSSRVPQEWWIPAVTATKTSLGPLGGVDCPKCVTPSFFTAAVPAPQQVMRP